MHKYIIISPVRNEEHFLRKTIESVLNQTVLPKQWIIVNDGSTDKTEAIIDEYCVKYKWIEKINLEDRGYYYPGTGIVNVVKKGYEVISYKDWEFVVKLDCDIEFEKNYFEKIFYFFDQDSKLGIASGCVYRLEKNRLIKEPAQYDHPDGVSKVYKRACWESIGGLMPIPGWDLADLLSAQMKGWNTRCYFDLRIITERQTGSRRKGIWGPKFLQGKFAYRHGYSFFYTVLRELSHLFRRPIVIGTIAQISGYIYAFFSKEEYLFSADMRAFLRRRHKEFLKNKLGLSK